ncbi:MAG TPA: ABC transporter permease [Chloroflexota bacterium]|nr:ABC transporter permease [Chloroflexota bacterium]
MPPGNVLRVAAATLSDPLFWQGMLYSVGRDAAGFAVGALAGIALGSLLGASPLANRLVGPSFHTLRQISLFAWLPLLSTWFGYGEFAKLVFIALSTLYPVTLGTIEAVRNISRSHAEVARVFCFTRRQTLQRLILPAAAPHIATGLTLGLVYAWVATIGCEFLLANWGNGLGNIVIKGRSAFNIELILVGMLAIGLVGVLLHRAASLLEARALRWRPRSSPN